ncbi:MAG: hypothetical protein ABR961_02565 [Thermoanaerobaculaceae bacterium]|jgi:hypothetical protein
MKRLCTVLLTAAIAFPLGVFAGDVVLKGHPNLQKAHHALHEADHWITESQKANEKVWGVEGGHAQRAKELIGRAKQELDLAAEWVNSHVQK